MNIQKNVPKQGGKMQLNILPLIKRKKEEAINSLKKDHKEKSESQG